VDRPLRHGAYYNDAAAKIQFIPEIRARALRSRGLIDGAEPRSYRRARLLAMNAKILFKTIFFLLMLLLLVMMGIYNKGSVSFSLPPILPKSISQPAAIMYFAFFALGFISSTILSAGGKGGGGGSKPSKPSK
jgi:uncharacterized integral membrane protein